MSDDVAPVWRVVIVACPDEGCLVDNQVCVADGDDASKIIACGQCGTRFYVSLPAFPR
jgi:hypothetical protein